MQWGRDKPRLREIDNLRRLAVWGVRGKESVAGSMQEGADNIPVLVARLPVSGMDAAAKSAHGPTVK